MAVKKKINKKTAKTPQKRVQKATEARKYDGAAKSKRLSRWLTTGNSANAEIGSALVTLRNRSRDLRRNNPYAAKAVNVITSNMVGKGIYTQFRGAKFDSPQEKSIDVAWWDWAHTKNIDYDGRHNIFGLQRLISDAVVESGEVLVRKRVLAGLKFPLQYQVLESDFLDINSSYKANKNNKVIHGIEFNPKGKIVAYHLYEAHPGAVEDLMKPTRLDSSRVPADQVIHLFRQDRPGQGRGVPWLAPSMLRLRDLDDYEDAQLVRQKIAACFAVFVKDIGPDVTDQPEACGDDLGDRVEPGLIEFLPPGKDVSFAQPPPIQNYKEYVVTHLHAIAAGIGITYEALTGDLSEVNFSSARMGWLEFQRNVEVWRESIMIAGFLDEVVKDFMSYANAFLGIDFTSITHQHTPPRREMIDPTKEVPAIIKQIRGGLKTISEALMEQGKDPTEHFKQFKKDMDLLDQLGLVLDSDPRQKDDSGKTVQDSTDNQGGVNE